jgi:hypothetical protein
MRKIYKVIKDGQEVKVTRDEYNRLCRLDKKIIQAEEYIESIVRPIKLDETPEELTPEVVDEILDELIRNDVEEAAEEKPKKKPKKKASKKKVTKTDD